MEVIRHTRVRTAYYFSWPDQEILDEHVLTLSCDEDTWLYKIEGAIFNGRSEQFGHQGSPLQQKYSPSTGGTVDSRTFTRRKHGSLRPSLDSLVNSPLFNNRSSLGLLSSSTLLNSSLTEKYQLKAENQGKTSSSSTVFETPLIQRVFKLDTPFFNSATFERNSQSPAKQTSFERLRFDSESSESSILPSLENVGLFEKNDAMTDSLVTFLEKEVISCPPTEFQDNDSMTSSLISLPADQNIHSILDTNGKHDSMTDSLINFLGPVNCKPPNGFGDNEMSNSVVSIKESDVLPSCEMTNSVLNYLENTKQSVDLVKSLISSESENIPPNNCDSKDNPNRTYCDKIPNHLPEENSQLNSTYNLENLKGLDPSKTLNCNGTSNITYTNNVNLSKRNRNHEETEEDLKIMKPIGNTLKRDTISINNNSSKNILSIKESKMQGPKNNIKKLSSCESLTDDFLSKSNESQFMNRTFSKSDLLEASSIRQIPLRNSAFNTTFTKLKPPSKIINKSTEGLNGGLEDDQTSSASDSSFSSGSTKPRSFDELQSIAQQQENSLVYQSTPTETHLDKLKIELSPIRGLSSSPGRSGESRSANCSPVRSSTQRFQLPHRVSRLHQPSLLNTKRQIHTSSLLNIARPQVSGLRMPQTISRPSIPHKTEARPITAPPSTSTGIPRPQASRLPMARFRSSGIPGPKKL